MRQPLATSALLLLTLGSIASAQECIIGMGKYGGTGHPCADGHGGCQETCSIRPHHVERGVWNDNRWPSGIIHYAFGENTTATNQSQARAAMDVIESWTNIRFVPRTDQPDFVNIVSANGNYSYVGRIGGSQELGMFNWTIQSIIIHELMHAAGVWHEQSRADRDTYVEVNLDAVQSGYGHNFNRYLDEPMSGSHDFESVMHYGPTGFSINGDRTLRVRPAFARAYQYVIGQRTGMSNGDIWTLTEMYGGNPPARNFTLTSPANGTAVGAMWMPQFSWAASQEATEYTLKVDDDPAFGSPAINTTLTQTTLASVVPLAPNRLYYWTVTSSNARGTGKPFPVTTHAFYTGESSPGIVYVDASAPAGGDGRSWATAMRDLQDALAVATYFGGPVDEVRVARGTYRPDRGTGDRTMSFWLASGVAVKGGYAGRAFPNPDLHDPATHVTILSGDLASNDGFFTNVGDNSYNVVVGSWVDSTAVLQGVTIRGGNANSGSFPRSRGGAIQIDTGSPVFRDCIIERSQSTALFGGVSISFGGTPRFERCLLRDLRTTGGSPNGQGGLVGLRHGSDATFDACTLRGGTARSGAAAYVLDAAPIFTNCLVTANAASTFGGAFHVAAGGDLRLVHVTATNNQATDAGSAGMVQVDANAAARVENSIAWGNTPTELAVAADGTLTAAHSIVQGGVAGTGNLNANPLLETGTFELQAGSPAIDSADTTTTIALSLLTDLAGASRRVDDPATPDSGTGPAPMADRGAYERPGPCLADFNGDGGVDGADVEAFFRVWETGEAGGDVNQDGGVDGADIGTFITAWQVGC